MKIRSLLIMALSCGALIGVVVLSGCGVTFLPAKLSQIAPVATVPYLPPTVVPNTTVPTTCPNSDRHAASHAANWFTWHAQHTRANADPGAAASRPHARGNRTKHRRTAHSGQPVAAVALRLSGSPTGLPNGDNLRHAAIADAHRHFPRAVARTERHVLFALAARFALLLHAGAYQLRDVFPLQRLLHP